MSDFGWLNYLSKAGIGIIGGTGLINCITGKKKWKHLVSDTVDVFFETLPYEAIHLPGFVVSEEWFLSLAGKEAQVHWPQPIAPNLLGWWKVPPVVIAIKCFSYHSGNEVSSLQTNKRYACFALWPLQNLSEVGGHTLLVLPVFFLFLQVSLEMNIQISIQT